MNGAIAELCAKMISKPKRSRTTTMGINHQRLPPHKNESNSRAIPKRRRATWMKLIGSSLTPEMHRQELLLGDEEIPDHQRVDSGAIKAADRIPWIAHQRLADDP